MRGWRRNKLTDNWVTDNSRINTSLMLGCRGTSASQPSPLPQSHRHAASKTGEGGKWGAGGRMVLSRPSGRPPGPDSGLSHARFSLGMRRGKQEWSGLVSHLKSMAELPWDAIEGGGGGDFLFVLHSYWMSSSQIHQKTKLVCILWGDILEYVIYYSIILYKAWFLLCPNWHALKEWLCRLSTLHF